MFSQFNTNSELGCACNLSFRLIRWPVLLTWLHTYTILYWVFKNSLTKLLRCFSIFPPSIKKPRSWYISTGFIKFRFPWTCHVFLQNSYKTILKSNTCMQPGETIQCKILYQPKIFSNLMFQNSIWRPLMPNFTETGH